MNATATDKARCEKENEAGVRCCYGPGHRCECSFKPLRLSDAQRAVIEELANFKGVRKYQCIGAPFTTTLKCLSRRGLIGLRYVNSRAWDAWINHAGMRAFHDLPR